MTTRRSDDALTTAERSGGRSFEVSLATFGIAPVTGMVWTVTTNDTLPLPPAGMVPTLKVMVLPLTVPPIGSLTVTQGQNVSLMTTLVAATGPVLVYDIV